jgi:hypothetical protein
LSAYKLILLHVPVCHDELLTPRTRVTLKSSEVSLLRNEHSTMEFVVPSTCSIHAENRNVRPNPLPLALPLAYSLPRSCSLPRSRSLSLSLALARSLALALSLARSLSSSLALSPPHLLGQLGKAFAANELTINSHDCIANRQTLASRSRRIWQDAFHFQSVRHRFGALEVCSNPDSGVGCLGQPNRVTH